MLSRNNVKIEDLFINSSSDQVHSINFKCTKNNKTVEKGRLEFMQILLISHEQLKINKNVHR